MKMYKTVGQLVKEGVIKEGTDLRNFGFKVIGERVKDAEGYDTSIHANIHGEADGKELEMFFFVGGTLGVRGSHASVSFDSKTNVEQDTVEFKGKTYYVEDNVMTEKKLVKVGDFIAIEDMPDGTTVRLTATVRKGKLVFGNLDFRETVVDVYERAGFEIVRLPEGA